MGLRGFVIACSIAIAACASSGEGTDDGESGDSAQSGAAYGVFTISGDAASGHLFAKAGYQRIAIVGPRIGELVIGQDYYLKLTGSAEKVEGVTTAREVVDFRKVLHLAGTIADAPDPASMTLTSIHGKTYALYGDTVGNYKGVRDSLPAHNYAKTLFTADIVERIDQPAHFTWIRYTPFVSYKCIETDKANVHLDLVSVQPDDSLFDGFVITETGGEPLPGARATCGAGKCTFDAVGDAWGTATFTPAATFPLEVNRPDGSKIGFGCNAIDRASVTSED